MLHSSAVGPFVLAGTASGVRQLVQCPLTSTVTRSHKFNDRDHTAHLEGAPQPEEHVPRYFAKSGPVDADPKKTKKNGGGKGNWGVEGDEIADIDINFTKARRRSNSSSNYGPGARAAKTKFEEIEHEPVFEEDLHGPLEDDEEYQNPVNTESSDSAISIDEDEPAKRI